MSEYTYNPAGYEQEMGWDDAIEQDAPEFVMVPPGDYGFTVTAFERARHNGSEKLPPCNKAVLTLRLDIPEEQGVCVVKHNLFLHKKTEGRLCEFFTAIGQRRHGERINMNWGQVVSASGRCKVGVRTYTGNDGREYTTNEITKFYEPAEGQRSVPERRQPTSAPRQTAAAPAGGWQPGKF